MKTPDNAGERNQNGVTPDDEPRKVVRRAAARRKGAWSEGFEGFGRLEQVSKSVLFAAVLAGIGAGVFGRFYSNRFVGLVNPAAAAQGAIANELRAGRGFATPVGYPVTIEYTAGEGRWKDVSYNPVYPTLLSIFFRVRGRGADNAIAVFNGLFHLVTAIPLYLICARLSNKWIGALAVLIHFISIAAIGGALSASGVSVTAFFATLTVLAAMWPLTIPREPGTDAGQPNPLWALAAGAAAGLTYLSGGITVLLIIPIALLAAPPGERRLARVGLVVAAFVVVIAPWAIRNLAVSGSLSPKLVEYRLVAGTEAYPGPKVFRMLPDEAPNPYAFALSHPGMMWRKFVKSTVESYRKIPDIVNPYLFPFVIFLGLLVGPERMERRLWTTLVALALLQWGVSCLYEGSAGALGTFIPLAVGMGTLCFVEVLARQKATRPGTVIAVVLLLAVLAFPYTVTLALGSRALQEDPTVQDLSFLRVGLRGGTTLATNVPTLAAWYSHKSAVLLPQDQDTLNKLAPMGVDPDYIYLSQGLMANVDTRNPDYWQVIYQKTITQKLTEEEAQELGQVLALPGGEFIFERRNKRAQKQPQK